MRKDPPVDNNYIYMTYILDLVDKKNTKVINSGFSLRNQNEKLCIHSKIPNMIDILYLIYD